jgi:hypothetical protein
MIDLSPGQLKIQRVVCAAIRHPRGWLIIGPRHFDKMMHVAIEEASRGEAYRMEDGASEPYRKPWYSAEQGFIDQWGNFLTRNEAWRVVARVGQPFRFVGSQRGQAAFEKPDDYLAQDLYSENLY